MPLYDVDLLRDILATSKTVAVVGASPKPERDSHQITGFLIAAGYTVFPVNPALAGTELLGRPAFATLRDIPDPVDMVDIFRRSEDVGPIVDDAIAINAKYIWMQLGVINQDAAAKAEEAGLKVVMDRCVKIEYQRLGL